MAMTDQPVFYVLIALCVLAPIIFILFLVIFCRWYIKGYGQLTETSRFRPTSKTIWKSAIKWQSWYIRSVMKHQKAERLKEARMAIVREHVSQAKLHSQGMVMSDSNHNVYFNRPPITFYQAQTLPGRVRSSGRSKRSSRHSDKASWYQGRRWQTLPRNYYWQMSRQSLPWDRRSAVGMVPIGRVASVAGSRGKIIIDRKPPKEIWLPQPDYSDASISSEDELLGPERQLVRHGSHVRRQGYILHPYLPRHSSLLSIRSSGRSATPPYRIGRQRRYSSEMNLAEGGFQRYNLYAATGYGHQPKGAEPLYPHQYLARYGSQEAYVDVRASSDVPRHSRHRSSKHKRKHKTSHRTSSASKSKKIGIGKNVVNRDESILSATANLRASRYKYHEYQSEEEGGAGRKLSRNERRHTHQGPSGSKLSASESDLLNAFAGDFIDPTANYRHSDEEDIPDFDTDSIEAKSSLQRSKAPLRDSRKYTKGKEKKKLSRLQYHRNSDDLALTDRPYAILEQEGESVISEGNGRNVKEQPNVRPSELKAVDSLTHSPAGKTETQEMILSGQPTFDFPGPSSSNIFQSAPPPPPQPPQLYQYQQTPVPPENHHVALDYTGKNIKSLEEPKPKPGVFVPSKRPLPQTKVSPGPSLVIHIEKEQAPPAPYMPWTGRSQTLNTVKSTTSSHTYHTIPEDAEREQINELSSTGVNDLRKKFEPLSIGDKGKSVSDSSTLPVQRKIDSSAQRAESTSSLIEELKSHKLFQRAESSAVRWSSEGDLIRAVDHEEPLQPVQPTVPSMALLKPTNSRRQLAKGPNKYSSKVNVVIEDQTCLMTPSPKPQLKSREDFKQRFDRTKDKFIVTSQQRQEEFLESRPKYGEKAREQSKASSISKPPVLAASEKRTQPHITKRIPSVRSLTNSEKEAVSYFDSIYEEFEDLINDPRSGQSKTQPSGQRVAQHKALLSNRESARSTGSAKRDIVDTDVTQAYTQVMANLKDTLRKHHEQTK